MDEATVNIADAFADAVRVPISEVSKGDTVFDVFGGRHTVKGVVTSMRHVRIIRDDNVNSYHDHDSDITIAKR